MKRHFLRIQKIDRSLFRNGFFRVCGIDEAGRGPLAGPVVACAVVFDKSCFDNVEKRRILREVYDSKSLSPSLREKLFWAVKKEAVSLGVGIIEARRIDEANILVATLEAMSKAVSELEVKPDVVLVDGNIVPPISVSKVYPLVKGDSRSFCVAAASIVAKVIRDGIMRELDIRYPEYGFAKHKGYCTKEHLHTLKTLGPCEEHRKSFKPVQEAMQLNLYRMYR